MLRFTATQATAWAFRALAWLTITWVIGWQAVALLAIAAVGTHLLALGIRALGERTAAARAVLAVGIAAHVLVLAAAVWPATRTMAIPVAPALFMCLGVAYLVDAYHGLADPRHHGAALLYLVQLPVFPAGPLSRFHEFAQQAARTDVSMAGFSYGVRRMATGLIKVYLIAGPLGSTAGQIFALRVTRLSTDTAWLGALCAALQVYFYLSGFSDVGIGLGKILGFRYQENFRRPYTADSIREFWRRWNVTLITWLRDYVSLPIAGHDRPTLATYLLTVAGFVIVGLWYRVSLHAVPWAVYSGSWLAVEAIGLGALIERLPRALRHAYVLLVVLFGWLLLWASGPGPLLGYVEAMLGLSIQKFGASSVFLTWDFVAVLVSAVIFAGPLVGNISRWRVSVDAATASLLMMLAATGILLWHWLNPLRRAVLPGDVSKRPR